MKICIFGQATGGNASIWFDYFNSKKFINKNINIVFISRTIKTLNSLFKIYSPYGHGGIPPFINRFYTPFVSRIGIRFLLFYLMLNNKFDGVIIQGNYAPSLNLILMKSFKCHKILNIYGSDFYRKYLLNEFSSYERTNFVKVLHQTDSIVFNWVTSYNDFIREFPELSYKCCYKPWGVSEFWIKDNTFNIQCVNNYDWPCAEKVFLSARAIYDYNNIELLVESFCKAFADNKEYKLFLVNGYGNHKKSVENVYEIISKYNAYDQVITKVGKWISDEELLYLYNRADYNFCIGFTDQLTVSIVYSFLTDTVNILSPIQSYKDLIYIGYDSPIIMDNFDVDNLSLLLKNLPVKSDQVIINDREKALNDFDIESTFNHYLSLIKNGKIIKDIN